MIPGGFGDGLVGRFNIGAKYMSDYNTGSDLDVEKAQDAFTVVNARLGFGRDDNRWMVELWAQNLFDEEPPIVLSGANAVDLGNHNPFGRIFSFELSKRF